MKQYLILARYKHWFKNLLIFIPLIFSGNVFNLDLIFLSIVGFFALTLASSAGYIMNDILDLKNDLTHKEKKNRPLVSGKIKLNRGIFLMVICAVFFILISLKLPNKFLIFSALLFSNIVLYSLFLKKIYFLDVITIGFDYVLRAVSGAYLIGVWISPWLILCSFLLATFVLFGKRKGDAKFGKKYPEVDNTIMFNGILIVFIYIMYSIYGIQRNIWITIPFVIYGILKYYQIICKNSEISRKPELVLKNKAFMINVLMYFTSIYIAIYL